MKKKTETITTLYDFYARNKANMKHPSLNESKLLNIIIKPSFPTSSAPPPRRVPRRIRQPLLKAVSHWDRWVIRGNCPKNIMIEFRVVRFTSSCFIQLLYDLIIVHLSKYTIFYHFINLHGYIHVTWCTPVLTKLSNPCCSLSKWSLGILKRPRLGSTKSHFEEPFCMEAL